MDVRIEAVAGFGVDRIEPATMHHFGQLLAHQADALGHLGLLVMVGGFQRPLEVVEHRQQLAHDAFDRPPGLILGVAGNPLAEVVEVGGHPAQVGQVLVRLATGLLQLAQLRLGRGRRVIPGGLRLVSDVDVLVDVIVGVTVHARSPVSDSSSTTSASTISSSESSAVSPLVPLGPVAPAA